MNLHNMNLHRAQHTAGSNNAIRNASMLPAKFERHRRPHSNTMQGQLSHNAAYVRTAGQAEQGTGMDPC